MITCVSNKQCSALATLLLQQKKKIKLFVKPIPRRRKRWKSFSWGQSLNKSKLKYFPGTCGHKQVASQSQLKL